MPLDSSGTPAAPGDLGELGRRLVQLERMVELGGGARTLTKASIGRGGLRVIKGGDIRIDDGGSLIIETGNLILGQGMIDGAALKSQLEPKAYQDSETGIGLTTTFATKASVTVSAPAWATTTIVQAYALANLVVNTAASDYQWNGALRLGIGGTNSTTVTLPAVNTSTTGTAFRAGGSLSFSRSVNTTTAKAVAVNADARSYAAGTLPADDSSVIALYVVALFFR